MLCLKIQTFPISYKQIKIFTTGEVLNDKKY